MPRRTTKRVESVTFNGIVFRRYPDSARRSDAVYYTPNGVHRAAGVGRLHEEIYKAHYGPIPSGHHVHHRDNDSSNNAPDNLQAKPGRQHLSDHHRGVSTPAKRENLERIRPKAIAWHGSPAGIKWHRQHAKRLGFGKHLPRETRQCEVCRKSFEALVRKGRSEQRFCSKNCKSAWRRKLGLDNETRQCVVCGDSFLCNKYFKTSHCSRACAGRSRPA